ncbi:hypothetical protein [Pseudomonas sp. LS-2]|jgi:hypothetical protein|uniref:hypothetical protein n=1 Tax=Pseudomonas sp. LS-2 TaxID=2315859 RepID=UPI001404BB5A|nr:hypothetical protein [Pseudomonas sp. LS-2]
MNISLSHVASSETSQALLPHDRVGMQGIDTGDDAVAFASRGLASLPKASVEDRLA